MVSDVALGNLAFLLGLFSLLGISVWASDLRLGATLASAAEIGGASRRVALASVGVLAVGLVVPAILGWAPFQTWPPRRYWGLRGALYVTNESPERVVSLQKRGYYGIGAIAAVLYGTAVWILYTIAV